MNPAREEEAVELAAGIEKGISPDPDMQIVLCPPFPYLNSVRACLRRAALGSQDISAFAGGAYTGQVSGAQLSDLGVKYCLVGHSERRLYAHERDEDIAQKIRHCLKHQIVPILCLGAGLKPEDSDAVIRATIRRQYENATHGFFIENILLAYEPTWAISTSGSGRLPDNHHVTETANFMRELIAKDQVKEYAVLYGGNVNGHDIGNFVGSVDGFLVGHASLDEHEFIQMSKNI